MDWMVERARRPIRVNPSVARCALAPNPPRPPYYSTSTKPKTKTKKKKRRSKEPAAGQERRGKDRQNIPLGRQTSFDACPAPAPVRDSSILYIKKKKKTRRFGGFVLERLDARAHLGDFLVVQIVSRLGERLQAE